MFQKCFSFFFVATVVFVAVARSQSPQPNAASSACPVEILSFAPAGVSIHIRNTSGKAIVGLVFNAAVADATEHWKWFHWDFDDSRPVRDFGWNKAIKPGAAKRLSWYWGGYLDFEHIGGGDLVLTSALYDDGSRWEDQGAEYACKCIWLKNKKSTFRAVKLPLREGK